MRVNRDLVPQGRSQKDAGTGLGADFDARRFSERMRQSDFPSELFLSPAHASWVEGRFLLNREEAGEARTDISGVRFQAADPQGEDLSIERQVQTDVVNLVRSVGKLRRLPGLAGVVLSRKSMRCRQPLRGTGTRVKFGLQSDASGRLQSDVKAAGACHRAIVGAVRRSGLVVEHPRRFDPKTGLGGLEHWGAELKLRRRRRLWPWLLLLPLLFLLMQLRHCGSDSFFGFEIETKSLIVVVDKSGSMEQIFPQVREEAKRTLGSMKGGWFGTAYANVITYDAEAQSALGAVTELTDETERRLMGYLDMLRAGGGTALRPAIEQAAREVAAHGKPTTLVILTDGQGDGSIQEMLGDMKAILDAFQDVEIVGHTLTPRLLTPAGKADPEPRSPEERNLHSLAEQLNGQFGPNREAP